MRLVSILANKNLNTPFPVPYKPSFELGEFSRKRKGGLPLKMLLGNFVRNLPFLFSFDLLFVFWINKNKTDALACALYFFLFINTLYYFVVLTWLNHGVGEINRSPKSTWLVTKKYMTGHQKVHDWSPKSTWLVTVKLKGLFFKLLTCYNFFISFIVCL